MKKIIALVLILCLCMSVTSCKNKSDGNELAQPYNESEPISEQNFPAVSDEIEQEVQTDTQKQEEQSLTTQADNTDIQQDTSVAETETNEKTEDDEDVLVIQGETSIDSGPPLEVDLRLACTLGTDMFTAKVIDSTPLDEKTEFFSINATDSVPVMYTVEVEEVYKDFIVTPKSTIRVVDYMIKNGTDEYWDNSLETGKTYLFGGWVEPYGEKPIVVSHGLHSAQIKEDGTFEYCSSNAKISLKEVATLKELITNEKVADIIYSKTDAVLLYESFFKLVEGTSDAEEIIDYLKEAIKVDSDKVLLVTDDTK